MGKGNNWNKIGSVVKKGRRKVRNKRKIKNVSQKESKIELKRSAKNIAVRTKNRARKELKQYSLIF